MFYIILNDYSKKVEGIYTDKSKAIIMMNFIQYEKADEMSNKKDIFIMEADKNIVDYECSETWTEIDLSDKPLDFELDVTQDLNSNNWIFDKFHEKQKQEDDLKARKSNKYTQDCNSIRELVDLIKQNHKVQLLQMFEDLVDTEKNVNDHHAIVVESRKKMKKNIISQKQLDDVCEKENEMRKVLGSKRKKYTNEKNKIKSYASKILKDKNINAHVDTYDVYENHDKIHVFTITLDNSVFRFYLKD